MPRTCSLCAAFHVAGGKKEQKEKKFGYVPKTVASLEAKHANKISASKGGVNENQIRVHFILSSPDL